MSQAAADQVYRRVGRGGAGNWYNKSDVEEAEKGLAKDVEAQKKAATTAGAGAESAGTYSRGGRGGAGNFHEPDTIGESVAKAEEAQKAQVAVAASNAKPRAGLGGRGGAGNWVDSSAQAAQVEQAESQKKAAIEAKTMQDVEAVLSMPPRTYHQHDREME